MIRKDLKIKIQKLIEKEEAQARQAMLNLKRDDPFSDPERVNDNAEAATDAYEDSEHLRASSLREEIEIQLDAIENAKKRIDDGTYGICASCGITIDEDRLFAMPTADVCIACERASETRQ